MVLVDTARKQNKKILAITHELGYSQNKSAVSLVSRKSNLLGIIMPQYATTFMVILLAD